MLMQTVSNLQSGEEKRVERRNGEGTGTRVEKRIFRRFRYTEDYRTTTYVGANGKPKDRVTYIGEWYCPVNPAEEYRSIVVFAWVLVILSTLAVFGALFSLPAPLEHKWYAVALSFSLFPLAYAIMGVARLPRKPEPMERARHDKTVLRLKHSAVAILVILGLTAVGLIVYWILAASKVLKNAAPYAIGDGIFLGCLLVAAAANILLYAKMKQIKTETRENSTHRPS